MSAAALVLAAALAGPGGHRPTAPAADPPPATTEAERAERIAIALGTIHGAPSPGFWRALGPEAAPPLAALARDPGALPSRRARALVAEGYATSVADTGQLKRQYCGLQRRHPQAKRCVIFLVPIDDGADMLDALVDQAFEALTVLPSDFKAIVTWQKNTMENVPSIGALIGQLLDEEARGLIDPIPEYTRHTLKALKSFIATDFAGYEYEREPSGRGINDATEAQLTVSDLAAVSDGYVGVKAGVGGEVLCNVW